MSANKCRNGHDKDVVGWTEKNGCRECKREAARRYAEARKAGVPINTKKSQVRTDLGYDTFKDQ